MGAGAVKGAGTLGRTRCEGPVARTRKGAGVAQAMEPGSPENVIPVGFARDGAWQ